MMRQDTVDALELRLWRDHDEAVIHLPGVAMGAWAPAPGTTGGDISPAVAALYRDGVRRVALAEPLNLVAGADPVTLVRAMVLLRELTSWGIVVDWQVRLGDNHDVWQRLNHLYPPGALLEHPDADRVLADWRETFYLCKCIHRYGPGFIQVRDRRAGELARFTIDDPEYLAAVDVLLDGAPASAVPAHILEVFVSEGLAGVAGHLAWWLPYRVRRWPWPSFLV